MGLIDAYNSLFADSPNKVHTPGVLDELPELELEMDDKELVQLADQWEKRYMGYEVGIKKRQERNKDYWKGKHFANKYDDTAQVDNLIFESLETFLPLATKKNPEPFVRGDESEESKLLAKTVQNILIFHADRLRLKLRMKRMTRDWALKLIGVMKHGWSETENDITTEVIKPENIIFDTEGYINDDMEYTGKYLGERKSDQASNLIARFPQKESFITKKVEGKLGTNITYTEWWNCNPSEYVFWKLDNEILGKAKNPHWNYDQEGPSNDENGNEIQKTTPGKNHFSQPKSPYTFISMFNTGDGPHDETSLIEQAIPNQDLINKRQKQITLNADSMNGGMVVSLERSGLNEDQATDVTEALRKGGTIVIPSGSPQDAIHRDQAPALPADIYQQLSDTREELRNIFGTRGSSPSGTVAEQTATGKTIVREQDSDRIGGGITEYLEQVADATFNWWVQLMMVYYDTEHRASIVGAEKSMQFEVISSKSFTSKLTVSVKEGSLIPDSDFENAGTAKDLAAKGDIDPITLFDKLGYSDPMKSAERLYMWKSDPGLLFPAIDQQIKARQQEQMIQQQAAQPIK